MEDSNLFDYIIIGAGSAGCVLANRLSDDPTHRVLLLEYGGNNNSIFIDMPTAFAYPMRQARYNWGFETVKEPHLNQRKINCPRGKGLGGSSAINGMVYVRGHAEDFNAWERQGARTWNYAHCLPYFQKSEEWLGDENKFRGKKGPLTVCFGKQLNINKLYQAFIDAGCEAGYTFSEDYNGYKQEGFSRMQMTVRNGVRCSTAKAYLEPIKNRDNLTIELNALVNTIEIDNGLARFVKLLDGRQFVATKEIIVSAGAINSPCILQRSGIGDPVVLREQGIKVHHSLPGVGKNLQDHLEVYFQYRCKKPITLNNKLNWLRKMLIGMEWLLFKTGLGSTNHFESGGFIRSKEGLLAPDIQYHFLPAAISYDGKKVFRDHGFQVHVGPNKPKSRGYVTIQSKDPAEPPKIQFNYLKEKSDLEDWVKCIRLTYEIFLQPAMREYRGELVAPDIDLNSDEAIISWVKKHVESAYHPCGTCKMGEASDPLSVVDENCLVKGTKNLRVVDASIFPEITNGNLNAPTIMVAERASDIILGKTLLPADNRQVWQPPDWQHKQRSEQPKVASTVNP